MTALQIYVTFILPALLVGIGGLAYWWTGRQDRPHPRGPAE